jgi:sortase B
MKEEQNSSEKNGKKKKKFSPSILIPIGLIIVMAVSGTFFLRDYMAYKQAKDEYKALDQYVTEEPATAESDSTTEMTQASSSSTEAEPEKTEYYPDLSVDYDGLLKVNPDFDGLLYVPSIPIRYPIAAGKDNDKYLHTTFEGTANASGSIFLDCYASKDFSDRNTIVYGHNMKNWTMFGSLKKFLSDDKLCASDPYVYIFQKDRILKYEIFSYYITTYECDAYNAVTTDKEYDAFVKNAFKRSAYAYDQEKGDIDFSAYPRLLMLSTCSGTQHVDRLIVHAALVSTIPQ